MTEIFCNLQTTYDHSDLRGKNALMRSEAKKVLDSGKSQQEIDSCKCTPTHKSIPLCWTTSLACVLAAVISETTNYKNHKDIVVT